MVSLAQRVLLFFSITLEVIDCHHLSKSEREVESRRRLQEEILKPFDLNEVPWRAILFCLSEKDHILLLNMHHTIFDGWSLQVFMQEMLTFYDGFLTGNFAVLPEPEVQYADFSSWQRQTIEEDRLKKQYEYWEDKLRNVLGAGTSGRSSPSRCPNLCRFKLHADDTETALCVSQNIEPQ